MFRSVLLVCAVLALGKGQITEVSQCSGNFGPRPILTVVEGCRTPPCELPQGQNVTISMVFQAPHIIQNMRTTVMAFLSFLPIPFDIGELSATCNYLVNTYCPVEQGELVVYTLPLPIEEFMPVGTQLPIEIRILDDNNVGVTCSRMSIRIVPPISKKLGA
ncbi:hypothetical protein PYW07_008428 [Mythimna separata]|uniref:MD-2-related lipid-recognition domain-containing protein n=1 Tax=Mythimna separata TaxID=271217 RepID=A0AAD7YD54_MYTSE|nr:hypothetical protein PYW07_008428 [Mythimna separata]